MSNAIDIGKGRLEISCPSCGRKQKITLHDMEKQRIIRCGCGLNVKLVDKNRSVAHAIRDTNRTLRDFGRNLKNIKIKF